MLLVISIILVSLALISYTVSVLTELIKGSRNWILPVFWLGFIFDLSGTIAMSMISKGFAIDFHSILGLTGLTLMLIKALWSTYGVKTIAQKNYTIISYVIWLAVFFSGSIR